MLLLNSNRLSRLRKHSPSMYAYILNGTKPTKDSFYSAHWKSTYGQNGRYTAAIFAEPIIALQRYCNWSRRMALSWSDGLLTNGEYGASDLRMQRVINRRIRNRAPEYRDIKFYWSIARRLRTWPCKYLQSEDTKDFPRVGKFSMHVP